MEEAVRKMLEVVRELEPGTRTSATALALKAGVDTDEVDAFDLHFELKDACFAESILLDGMRSLGEAEDLPRCPEFVVRPIVNPHDDAVALDDLVGLCYSEGGFHQGRREMVLLKDDVGRFFRSTSLSVAGQSLLSPRTMLSRRCEAVLSRTLARCTVRAWKREYADYEVLDGEQWELCLALADGTAVVSSGCNAYPENFEELRVALEKIGLPAFR